jgi:PAS domain S-box-containing protein
MGAMTKPTKTGNRDAELRLLDAIVENIPDMIFVKDAETLRFVRFNRAGEALLGIPREAMYGRCDHDFFPKDEADAFTAQDRGVLAAGTPVDIAMEPIRTARKGVRHLHTRKVPILDDEGRPLYLLGISEDVTERVQAEQARDEAARALAAESARLREANRRLAEVDRLRSEFVANVSHELRTPLTLVLAPVESLLAGEAGALNDAQRRLLTMVHGNAVRQLRMVGELLDLARIETGRVEVQREPTDVAALLRRVVADFGPLAAGKRIALNVEAEDATPVELDRYLFERIVFNLVSNALKFTPEGGRVTVELARDGDRLSLRVSDTGIGIDPEVAPALFERFRQLDSSSTRRHEGTGIGLALVKEFAGLLGGDVGVESRRGEGATFVVRLEAPPAVEAAAPIEPGALPPPPLPAAAPTPAVVASGHKVLIAEDNPEMAAYVAAVLADVAVTRHARDGLEALAIAREWRPDLMIADVMMPRCDGIELCRRVKADPELVGVPVVMLTALTQRDALLRGWEAGADEYLFKPFHPKELRTRIERMLAALDRDGWVQRLRQANDELARFARLASHDLKGPIRSIASYADLLAIDQADRLDDEGRHYVDVIAGNARRLFRVVEDTLRLSDLGQQVLRLEEADVGQLVGDAAALLQGQLDEAGAEVRWDGLPRVVCDASLITRAFQNLIENAVKFRRRDVPLRVRVEATRGDRAWTFAVHDNGIGIDPAGSERIFDPFVRLEPRSAYPGDGMGLATVKRIVELHGGRVRAEGSPGEGATIAFTLPDVAAEAAYDAGDA